MFRGEAHVFPILHSVNGDLQSRIRLNEASWRRAEEEKLSNEAIFKRNEAEALSTRRKKNKIFVFNFSTFSAFYFILCCVEYFLYFFTFSILQFADCSVSRGILLRQDINFPRLKERY